MEITNRNNFPDALVKAILNDPYNKGAADYSITELLNPPRLVALKAKHKDELEDDVEDRLWSLYGQIAHTILERANVSDDIVETRYFATFKAPNGDTRVVSAQVDTLSLVQNCLSDWKFTTAWKFKNNSPPDPNWIAQLNGQLEILRRNNLDAERLRIVGLLRDWSKLEAKRANDYPQKGVISMPIPMWSREQTTSFIEMRIALMERALAAETEVQLPLCTPDERWAKPDIWAVMKGEKAIKGGVCFVEKEAHKKLEATPGARLEFRPGISNRCESYCQVSQFCKQFQSTKGDSNVRDSQT